MPSLHIPGKCTALCLIYIIITMLYASYYHHLLLLPGQ